MAHQQSPQEFARALKSSADPPQPGGPSKIEIAATAWHNAGFDFPGKRDIIVEWILTRFLKGGQQKSLPHPLVDLRYWELLWHIMSPSTGTSQPIKTWLAPMVYPIPVAHMLQNYFSLLKDLPEYDARLTSFSCKCMSVIWPLSAQKLASDALLECYGSFLKLIELYSEDEHMVRFGLILTSSLRTSLGNGGNQRKLCGSFIQAYLKDWALFLSATSGSSTSHAILGQAAYTVGANILFNLETIKYHLDQKSEHAIFGAIHGLASSCPSIIDAIPRLFGSFVTFVKKNRASLFAQSSKKTSTAGDDVRTAAIRFYISCRSALEQYPVDERHMSARLALATQLDQENIYQVPYKEAEVELKKEVDFCISHLNQPGCSQDLQSLSFEYLAVLARIHHGIIEPSIPLFFPHLLYISCPSAFTLLHLLLDYHTKTRTVDQHIQHLIETASTEVLARWSGDPLQGYLSSSAGALLHADYLDRLAKSVYGFLTPLQTFSVAQLIADSFDKAWNKFHDNPSPNDDGMEVDQALSSMGLDATAFSHNARISSIVFSSLHLQAVPKDVRLAVEALLQRLDKTVTKKALGSTLKLDRWRDTPSAWATQIVTAATLRLKYALLIAYPDEIGQLSSAKFLGKALEVHSHGKLLPELRLELVRILVFMTEDRSETKYQVLDTALRFATQHISTPGIAWNGLTYALTEAQRNSENDVSLALLHMLIQRWLPTLDDAAYEPQLQQLVACLMSIPLDTPQAGFGASNIVVQALHSAQFWEHSALRSVLIAAISERLEPLGDPEAMAVDQPSSSTLQSALAALRLLLAFPPEFIPRSNRVDFTKKAYALDALLFSSTPRVGEVSRSLVFTRTFAYRMINGPGSVELPRDTGVQFIKRVLAQEQLELSSAHTSITLKLVETQFAMLFKSSNDSKMLVEIFKMIETLPESRRTVKLKFLICLADVLTKEGQFSQAPEESRKPILAFFRSTETYLDSQMAVVTGGEAKVLGLDVLRSWHRLLVLGRWIGKASQQTRKLSSTLLARLRNLDPSLSADEFEDFCAVSIGIFLEEVHFVSHRIHQLEVTLATYASLCHKITRPEILAVVNSSFSRAAKGLSTAEYAHVLSLAAQFLASAGSTIAQRQSILQLTSVLLRDPPQGSLKIIQSFTSKALADFAGDLTLVDLPRELHTQALEFVSQCCVDRPAALRLVDLGSIWPILTNTLAISKRHDSSTSTEIFHHVVNILGALVRLRRDLVVHTLPQLGLILQQLVQSLRHLRENLGPTQRQLVANTLPRWINPDQPLGIKEAKALARLFESLSTKTIPRNNAPSPELQKAESLAKPLSKHVSFVLKTYIDAMNDQLSMLPLSTRRELRPGLYALCSMLSNHCRDALMVSALDAGGKTAMKMLWKEYEKQRYQGRG
ncbi:hypothetical protein HGRIS_007656 [Hohenbuehelia grisea]|uniref:Nucleolar 27S pre-rRNA processing Urb2/Npa2 C-terminal domain-containing protein n=1 Tax=Hohenbuehelia grisea TaxID=104357 RepID=A0ABR3J5W7_9AGAR